MQNLRKKFPVLNQCIYANTAATGLLYEDLMEWRQEHDLDYLIGGSTMKVKSFEHMPSIKETLGKFFHCRPENVALVPNFSLGMNLLLEGLPKTQKILLLENDYPSVNWPFETRGFQIEFVKIDESLETNIHKKVKKGNVDVLALSVVQWINGVKVDLEFLKQLKKDFPHLLIIADGTQFCSTEPFNFEESGIDILGASGYKWLLAGYGNAFFLVKDVAKEHFDLKGIGSRSFDEIGATRENISFCQHLQPGHLDSLNFGSLEFSLNFLDTIGINHIADHLTKLSHKAKMEFANLGLLEKAVVERNHHSTIFNIKGNRQLFSKFAQENVVCSQRGDGIRLSFHFYNTENEIDAIVDIIRS